MLTNFALYQRHLDIFFILKKNARTMQNQHRVEHFKITNEKPTLSWHHEIYVYTYYAL